MKVKERRAVAICLARVVSLVMALVLACAGLPAGALAEQEAGGELASGQTAGSSLRLEGNIGGSLIEPHGSLGTDEADSVIGLGDGSAVDGVADDQGLVVLDGEPASVVPQLDGEDDAIALETQASTAHVRYRTHVQSYGWQGFVSDGEVSGTSGQAKRLEGIELALQGAPYSGSIQYRTHVQGIGWQGWVADGAMAGTSGQARRLEAIEIKLTGKMSKNYDVYYRVHAQSYGWMGWAKNGARAGTATMGKRLEAIQVVIHPKGTDAPPNTYRGISRTYAGAYVTSQVQYRTHVQSYGWQGWSYDGQMSGTSGQAKRLEAAEIRLAEPPLPGSIQYRTHVQTYGWQGWVADGAMSGTSGQAKRLEAIQIRLAGEVAESYDVWYRVHAQHFGWMGWTKNGSPAGTEGYAYRLEAIEIRLTAKGADAPGPTAGSFVKSVSTTVSYETLYKSVIEYWANEAKSMNKYNPKYVYFLFDIDRNGIKELIVDNKGQGTAYSYANVYTANKRGNTVTIEHCGQSVGLAGFRSFPRDYNGRLRAVHRMADGIEQYEIEMRNGNVVDNLIGLYNLNQTVQNEGNPITYYNIYSNFMGDYNTAIDYSGLRKAGSIKL